MYARTGVPPRGRPESRATRRSSANERRGDAVSSTAARASSLSRHRALPPEAPRGSRKMPAFGSSAKRLQGDVEGSAAKKKPSSPGGFQPSRKSFFQSLDPAERAALLKVAPSLRAKFDETGERVSSPSAAPRRRAAETSDTSPDALARTPPSLRRGVLGSPPGRDATLFDSSDTDAVIDEVARRNAMRALAAGSIPAAPRSPRAAAAAARRAASRSIAREKNAASAASPRPASAAKSPESPSTSPATMVGPPRFDASVTRDLAERESALRHEVERLRVQSASLAAENDGMRAKMDAMRRERAESEGSFALQTHELDRLRARAVGDGAARAAELEDRCERQRRMLQDLAQASEALAKDNVLLSSELVSARDERDEQERVARQTAERLGSAQRLYLAGQRSLERVEDVRAARSDRRWEKKLDALLTPEVLAKSRPPAKFPADAGARQMPLASVENGDFVNGAIPGALIQERQKLHAECAALRKRCEKAESAVHALQTERLATQTDLAAARKGGGVVAERTRKQLTGALRRLQWLVERVATLEGEASERDEYVSNLERRLLAQHRTMGKMATARNLEDEGEGGDAGGPGGRMRDGAPASARSSLLRSGGRGGWVTGASGRTPAARGALSLARRARVASSPGGMDARDAEEEEEEEEEEASDAGGSDAGGAGSRSRASKDSATRRVDEATGREEAAAQWGPFAAIGGTPGGGAGGGAPGAGEEAFSLDGIQAFVGQLRALHEKSEMAMGTPTRAKGEWKPRM